MGKQVYDLAIRDIPDISARKDKVLALAKSHETIAADVSQAVAGVPAYAHLKEPKAIVDATVKSNRAAVGTDRQAYRPVLHVAERGPQATDQDHALHGRRPHRGLEGHRGRAPRGAP